MDRTIIPKNRARPFTVSTSTAEASQAAGSLGASPISSGGPDAPKVTKNVPMRFRMNTFAGDNGELWNEYVAEYQQVARDYNLDNQQKLQYLHNSMGGDA